jgi:hypothetical protein
MADAKCEIHFQGGSLELSTSFDTVRRNLDAAEKARVDYENGNIDGVTRGSEGEASQLFNPYQRCTFKDTDEAKIAVNPEKVIALTDLSGD